MSSRAKQQKRDEEQLRTAARSGDLVTLHKLLGGGVNANAVGSGGKTPLHLAAEKGKRDCIEKLLDSRADVITTDGRGMTPLHWAAQEKHRNCAVRLIEGGAEVDAVDENMQTPLHCAARSGSDTCVTSLLLRTADANARDKDGRTPLHVAAANNHVGCVHKLLDQTADVNALDTNGWSPLHHAVSSGKIECLAALVDGGAVMGAVNAAGQTASQLAQERGHDEVLAELVSLEAKLHGGGGADPSPASELLATGIAGMTILDSPSRPALPAPTIQPPTPTPPAPAPTPPTPGRDGGIAEVQWQELNLHQQLEEGTHGAVHNATWKQRPVTVKVFHQGALAGLIGGAAGTGEGMQAQHLHQEASLMSRMRHDNLVLYMGMCEAPLAVITEFCGRGSLRLVLSQAKTEPDMAAQLTWARRVAMALDVAKGMLYLHTRQPAIIHRDLKSPNILITQGWDAKVTDFWPQRGMSTDENRQAMHVRWRAPEIINGQQRATRASDVYSFGMVLYELFTWEMPWYKCSGSGSFILAKVGAGERPVVRPAGESADLVWLDSYESLMRRCWAHQPHERPQFDEIKHELGTLLERVRSA